MKNTLADLGWIFNRNCNCGGYYNEIFQKGKGKEIEVWIQPNANTFMIKQYGDIIKRKTPANKLKEVIEYL